MRQAAHYDLHAVEGLARVQHLRFVTASGEVDTQYNGMTIRGGVLDDGIRTMPGSEVIDGRCALHLPRLVAGCHRYDILIADHGTDKPLLAGVIHVAPRVTPVDVDDNAPADYLDIVIPEDEDGTITVISESPAWVADALEACLPDALHDAGVYLTPTTGESTLSTGPAETPALVPCYAMAWGDELLAGHLLDGSRLRKVNMVYYNDAGNKADHWLRIWRQDENGSVVVGVAPAVPQPSSGELITWDFTPGVPLRRGDAIIMEMCVGSNADNLETHGLAVHGVMTTAKAGRGIADTVSYPVHITQPDIAPVMSVVVEYAEGIMVGGVEIATAAQMQSLGSDVRTASADAVTASRTAETAKTDAQAAKDTAVEIVNGLTITAGTVTTGEPGSQAAATLTPGSAPGSYTLDMTIPQGTPGTVDTAQAYVWTQPQTYDAMINANGGINIPLAVGAPTATAAVNRIHAAGMAIVDEMFRVRFYLDASASTATNNAVISAPVANQVLRVYLQVGMTTTAHVKLVPGILAYNNYSNFAGVVLPVRLVSASKITFAMGKIAVTANDDLPLDAYTLTPASQITTFGEILDITFTTGRDAAAGGYHVRTREIYWSKNSEKWMVKTTQALLALSSNVVIPGCVARVVYQQYTEGGIDTDERGALWLIVTGGTPHACQKIATVRGVHNYESFGLRDYYLDITNPYSWPFTVMVEAATVMTAWDNGHNPAYYGFAAIETNAIQSETVEEFPVE